MNEEYFRSGLCIVGLLCLAGLVRIILQGRSRRYLPLPPGPKPLPVIGSLLDLPDNEDWLKYSEWNRKYGDLVYLKLPRDSILVLGTVQNALDLLEKRSAIYSSRPSPVMDELTMWDFNMGLMPYSNMWRMHRKAVQEHFHLGVVSKYTSIQLEQTRSFLRRSLSHPKDVKQHVRHLFTAMIVQVVYGKTVEHMNDGYVTTAQKAVEGISQTHLPGKFWVDYFPLLRYLPSWAPGTRFQKVGKYYRRFVEDMRDVPFDLTKDDMAKGLAGDSLARRMISKVEDKYAGTASYHEHETVARNITGVAYAGGTDTTTSAAQSFLLAMALFPHVQREAQVELEKLVGLSRLPDIGDFDSLHYVRAIALESMRWMPVLPLGVSHMVIVNDEYKGYSIPKGTVIIPNVWAMLHDPRDYPSPEEFNPRRYLKDGKLDTTVRSPLTIAFGFGRRICPGRHFAFNSLFLFIASVLHVYNVEAGVGPDGESLANRVRATSGLLSSPDAVPCNLVVRSNHAKQLILDET